MSRHRNVRAIDVDEEYDGYYSCYGRSVEDEFCISPRTEAQFLYDRSAQKQSIGAYMEEPGVVSAETHSDDDSINIPECNNGWTSELSGLETAKLRSCIEAMQDVVGNTIPEADLKKAALDHEFDFEQALNAVLRDKAAPKPQRIKKSEPQIASQIPDVKGGAGVGLKSFSNACDNSHKNCEAKCDDKKSESLLSTKKEGAFVSSPSQKKKFNSCSETPESEEVNVNSVKSVQNEKSATLLYTKERGNEKPLINLVVIGHVDAGKSTLMGHLLYRLGHISKKAMHKFEQDSKKLGKASFMYAWVLDETPEERNRGITMDVAQSKFETTHKSVVLLDAPGHKDFIPNMITGAAQADVAILVVDSTKGEFETGFEAGGQTREHTMLIRSLGVSQVAVAVNKMDNINWEEDRFNLIKSKLSLFLKQIGFKESDVTFVPCSGLTGENLIDPAKAPELKKWYSGPTVVEVIDNFNPPERLISKPFRMCVSDVFKGISGGFCIAGKIEAGFVKTGDKILVMPATVQAVVKGLSVDDSPIQHGFAGDNLVLQLSGVDMNDIAPGSMVSDIERPVKVTTRFEARLVIFNICIPITKGFPVILHYQSLSEQATITKLISQLNRSTGEVVKKKPRCLSKNSSAVVEIQVNRLICIELFKDFKDLGRFMLRNGGSTIAAGLVTKIE